MGGAGIVLLGSHSPRGPVAFDRLRVRIDVAALWVYLPPSQDGKRGGTPPPPPWVGLGLYTL